MKKTLLLLPILFLASLLNGQVETPVTWSFEAEAVGNNEYDLVFKAKISEGWKTYSPFQSYGDDVMGPVPTGIYFDEGSHFEVVGTLTESNNRKEAKEPLFDNITVAYFQKYATFTQRVKVSAFGKPITGYVESMACDEEKCLPPSAADFSFALEPAAAAASATPDKPKAAVEAPTAKADPAPSSEQQAAPSFSVSGTEDALVSSDAADPSGIKAPVSWSFASKLLKDSLYEVTFTADVEEGWTIYSIDTSPDDGPLPTSFSFEDSDSYALVGSVSESGKTKTGIDPVFKVEVTKFVESPAVFSQQIIAFDPDQPVTGFLTYMTCNDAECIPADLDFALNLSAGAGGVVRVDPASGLKAIDQTVPGIRETYKSPVATCGNDAAADEEESSLFWTFFLGFAGGLLALLTPCVFPMVPLTVSFFTKSSKDRKTGFRNALIYGLSIIVIYVAIGLLITGVFGATALNALSTNWIANTLFFAIFVFFAFSFFGYYELTLPSSWTNKSDAMADRGGLIGIFFMAFTLALVSFSCTGPIIGSALVQSATSSLGPFVVMLGFSTALALPFALFAAFPGWLNSLPRSGGWMNSVKVVLGFLELALALKFLSVADMTMHWGILPYEVFLGAWILVFIGLTAYLFGWIKFPHDSPVKKLSPTRGAFAFLSLAFTVYLFTGFMYNDDTKSYNALKLMSGLAPPANYNVLLTKQNADESIKARYPSFSKCANDLDCFKNYEEGMAYAKENKMPVLLDFTGYGCVNCRKTEEHIWVEETIKNRLEQDFVLISLYVDDRRDLEETLLSIPRQEKLRNIGNLWADFQIVNFEQNSQPLYVMMSPDEQVLAPPRGYQEGVQSYADFLECGINTFQGLDADSAPGEDNKPLGSNN